jgi:hypothetical protein
VGTNSSSARKEREERRGEERRGEKRETEHITIVK